MPRCVCRKVTKNGSFFRLQVNKKMSLYMGVIFTASVYMGKDFLDVWIVCIYKSTGNKLQSI